MKKSTLKILLGFEIFKIFVAVVNFTWLVDNYPILSIVISSVSILSSYVAVAVAGVTVVAVALALLRELIGEETKQ